MTTPQNAQDRDRLYLALYLRDGVNTHSQDPSRYHWALLLIPSQTQNSQAQAIRIHARDYFIDANNTHWIYEEIHVSPLGTPKLLVKVFIGEVGDEDRERLLGLLREVEIKQEEEGWNCVSWVEEAVEMVWEDGVLESGREEDLEELKRVALVGADGEVGRRENKMKALL